MGTEKAQISLTPRARGVCYNVNMRHLISPNLVLFLTTSAIVLGSCTSTPTARDVERLDRFTQDARFGEQVNSVCFKGNIDNFRGNTRDSVIVRRGVSDEYVLFIDQCRDLEYANALTFDGSGSCLRKFDRLRVFQSGIGGLARDRSPELCQVEAIYRWNESVDAGAKLTKP